MKFAVMETKGNKAVILLEDGSFRTIKNRNYTKGQEAEFQMEKAVNFRLIFAVAAAAILFTITGFAAYYNTPANYISIDVNPGIELTVNGLDRVIAVSENSDAEAILKGFNLVNKRKDDAVKIIVNKISENGYLDGEGSTISIAVTDKSKDADKQLSDVEEKVKNALEENGKTPEIITDKVALARREEAKALGITSGKLNLIQKLEKEKGEDVDVSQYTNMPVKEIQKQTKEAREANKQKDNTKGKDDENANSSNVSSSIADSDNSSKADTSAVSNTSKVNSNSNKDKNSNGNGNGNSKNQH